MDPALLGGGILVADDTIDSLRLLTGVLAQQGHEVRPVTSGRQALQAAEHMPPELILLDVNMPDMNGYEVCSRLKANPALSDIPVIFLTALTDTASKLKGFNVGGADYVTKPFQINEVVARVNAQLTLRRAQLELKHQYERLCALERLRDDLVHMVVHDMRSPISALFCTLEVLLAKASALPSSEAQAEVQAALGAASALNRMTNDLLDVSRLEEDKFPLALGATDVVNVAHQVRSALASLDRERTIEVSASGPIAVTCDRGIVQRILENLVSNAIKHTPSGGRIQISLAELAQCVRVTVRDEGPGVPLDARTKIFEKFGTVSVRKSDAFHSAGLGLTFCKLAVEAHGGSIGVDCMQPRGSSFWFELPA